MKVVIAIDSFKGSLSTFYAGDAVAEGIHRVYPDAETVVFPIADGGEGTVDALTAQGGTKVTVRVCGPLGEPTEAVYGIMENGKTAVIEMSAVAGITLVPAEKRNPLYTTTYGVGELILDAAHKGCRNFVIGIGGSATNDGGVGMLQALGYVFLDKQGTPISRGASGLKTLDSICIDHADPILRECNFSVACDVKNPLCGPNGCSAIYGPQKGADQTMIASMDAWLNRYAELTKPVCPESSSVYPGAGAAGGMGFAFMSYLGAKLLPGIELVMQETHLEDALKDADIVVTGEGRLDGQSCMGKAPVGVASLAKKYGKTVLAFSGCVTPEAKTCNSHGIDAYFPVLRTVCTLEEAMDANQAYRNAADAAEQAFRLIYAMQK